jgi:hypothetical protein
LYYISLVYPKVIIKRIFITMKTVKKTAKKVVKKSAVKGKIKAKAARPSGKTSAVTVKSSSVSVSDRTHIDVVEMGENSFVIVINGARNFFERDEMKTMVRLCHQAVSESDAATRLYSWFSNKRKDVLIDTKIFDPHDMALKTIYKYLVNNYSVSN